MSDFWKYVKGIFSAVETSSPSQPAIHELIERTAEEKEDYAFWKDTLVRRRLTDWLSQQYALYQVLPLDVDESLTFLHTPSSKGFAIHFHQTQYSKRDAVYLLDFLKEKVSNLNYRTQISDTRTYSRPNWVETLQQHYLKPRVKFEENEPMNQLFGNITIELLLRNEQPHLLKLIATAYQDRSYHPPLEFKHLMLEIL